MAVVLHVIAESGPVYIAKSSMGRTSFAASSLQMTFSRSEAFHVICSQFIARNTIEELFYPLSLVLFQLYLISVLTTVEISRNAEHNSSFVLSL